MRTREGEEVSTLAPVVEQTNPDEDGSDETDSAETAAGGSNGAAPETAE
jgi:hypothetical protein